MAKSYARQALGRLPHVPTGQNSEVSSRVFTVPNGLSFIRLCLVPVFLILLIAGKDLAALIVLVFSSISDYFDGVIARKFGQITRLGQLLDPAADRLFIFAALIGLAVRGILPWWLFLIIVARDVMLLVLGITLANFGFGPLPVHHLGKLATFSLFYALPILTLGQAFGVLAPYTYPIGWAFALWGAFLYWWAGIVYAIETARVIRIPRVEPGARSDTLGSIKEANDG
jgi:cardiolipin synthase